MISTPGTLWRARGADRGAQPGWESVRAEAFPVQQEKGQEARREAQVWWKRGGRGRRGLGVWGLETRVRHAPPEQSLGGTQKLSSYAHPQTNHQQNVICPHNATVLVCTQDRRSDHTVTRMTHATTWVTHEDTMLSGRHKRPECAIPLV